MPEFHKNNELRELAAKAVLLLSKENRIIRRAIKAVTSGELELPKNGRTRRENLIAASYEGLTAEAMRRWIRGEVSSVTTESLDHIIGGASTRDVILERRDFTDEVSKYDFGEKLGFSYDSIQKTIDKEYFGKLIYARGFYLKTKDAMDLQREYSNIYAMYHFAPDTSGSDRKILRSTLRVRYALSVTRKEIMIVRCKLHVPSDDESVFYAYDGVLTKKERHLYFYFEEVSRMSRDGRDMLNLTCQCSDIAVPDSLSGMLISVSAMQQLYAASAYLVKQDVSNSENRESIMKAMREPLRIYDEEELRLESPEIIENIAPAYSP